MAGRKSRKPAARPRGRLPAAPPRTRGPYGCGFCVGDLVRVKHGRKLYVVRDNDSVGMRSGDVYLEAVARDGSKRYARAPEFVLVRKAAKQP